MAFTDTQVRLLKAKLDPKHIRTRNSNGSTLSYVEGWHAIAECGSYRAVYVAKVRVTVRAGDVKVVREGSGTCESSAVTAGQAHELALKGAETDATKRALATFGNPFGLALYDREQTGVRKLRAAVEANLGPWILRSGAGSPLGSYQTPSAFIEALRRAMSDARDIELLYDVWEKKCPNASHFAPTVEREVGDRT